MNVTALQLAIGSVFAGHRIDGLAGRGGMGVVYRATQLALDRTVALKTITPTLAEDPEFRTRFVAESKLAASIDHPNVIPIYYAGEHEGVLYLVMRFVEGDDLRTLLRAGPLPADRAARIAAQVAAALDAAHARGLVHRDVKPANVLLASADHAYLTDFGLTKRVTSEGALSRAGGVVGTLGYIAPEQIRGERVDGRADVYALGCVLFHMLAGHEPFPRERDEARLWAHLNEAPPSLRDAAPGVPERLGDVVARALAKDPDDRYQSAGDLGRAALAAAGEAAEPAGEQPVAVGPAAPAGTPQAAEDPTRTALTLSFDYVSEPTTPTGGGASGRRLPRWWPAAAAALLVAAAVAAIVLASGGGSRSGTGSTATTAARPAGRVVATIPVGPRPNSVTVEGGSVWVTSPRAHSVTRVGIHSTRPRQVARGLPLGTTSVEGGFGAIWVTNQRTRSVTRLPLATGAALGPSIPIAAGQPFAVAVGEGAVWVGSRSGFRRAGVSQSVSRIDPGGSAVGKVVPVARGVQDVATGAGAVWVSNRFASTVTPIDPFSGKVRRAIPVGRRPEGIAVGDGFVWVANTGSNTVTRIDPRSGATTDIRVGDLPTDVAVAGGNVWVSTRGDRTLTRIDAASRAVVGAPVRVGLEPFAVAAQGNQAWVTNLGEATVSRVVASG